jgi:uncharacterized protein (TIGR02453 family)
MTNTLQKDTLKFLKELKKNNNRQWFTRNKDFYLESLDDFRQLVERVILGIAKFDDSVLELDPKKCLFRIYRDTRFAKDKSPYKTNFGAHINMGGKDSHKAGYYIHVEPGESFLGGGLYHPCSERLTQVRQKISKEGAQFRKIINTKSFKDNFELWGDQLKTCPKGFDKDDPMVEYLRYKDLVLLHGVPDKGVTARGFETYSAKIFRKMVPFNNFLNDV